MHVGLLISGLWAEKESFDKGFSLVECYRTEPASTMKKCQRVSSDLFLEDTVSSKSNWALIQPQRDLQVTHRSIGWSLYVPHPVKACLVDVI